MARNFRAIFRNGNLQHPLDMLGVTAAFAAFVFIAQTGINTPMHEHPEARLAPPRQPFVVCLHGLAPPRGFGAVLGG